MAASRLLILLDELSVYLRKVRNLEDARDQLTAFLTSLFKAVEGAANAALVYTLAIGKDGRATDAYRMPSDVSATTSNARSGAPNPASPPPNASAAPAA